MPTVRQRKHHVAVVGRDLSRVTRLGITMERFFDPSIVHSSRPFDDAIRSCSDVPACVIVPITPRDSIVDLRALVRVAAPARLLFLAETLPLAPGAARCIRNAGHAVLDEHASGVVIEATVIALLAGSASTT